MNFERKKQSFFRALAESNQIVTTEEENHKLVLHLMLMIKTLLSEAKFLVFLYKLYKYCEPSHSRLEHFDRLTEDAVKYSKKTRVLNMDLFEDDIEKYKQRKHSHNWDL
jgi:hypothetical protein